MKSVAVPVSSAQGSYLNSRLHGGGKTEKGGPNLLDGLAKVVSKFKSASNSLVKGQVEHVLLDALAKLLERAKNNPQVCLSELRL